MKVFSNHSTLKKLSATLDFPKKTSQEDDDHNKKVSDCNQKRGRESDGQERHRKIEDTFREGEKTTVLLHSRM